MKTNWELIQKSFETVVDNSTGSFILAMKDLPDGASDFYMDVEIEDEEHLYEIIGMLKLFIIKASFEHNLDVDLTNWE